jgi:hypothetical protein
MKMHWVWPIRFKGGWCRRILTLSHYGFLPYMYIRKRKPTPRRVAMAKTMPNTISVLLKAGEAMQARQ